MIVVVVVVVGGGVVLLAVGNWQLYCVSSKNQVII
jgi:hypothetical protein